MKELSVTRDHHGNSGVVPVLIRDILYLEFSKKLNRVIVHTAGASYYIIGTKDYWTNVINSSGYVFRDVDRSYSVNVEKIKWIDKTFLVAHFGDGTSCTMSVKKFNQLIEEFPLLGEEGLSPA